MGSGLTQENSITSLAKTLQPKNLWLGGILLCGLILRVGSLNDPISYDEAYNAVEFASRSWWAAISDYSLPNNHIFHTLLVRASSLLLIFFILLPLAMTMALIWKTKEVILDAVFGARG